MFKVSNKSTRKRCEICSTLTLKTPEWRHDAVLLLLLLTLNIFYTILHYCWLWLRWILSGLCYHWTFQLSRLICLKNTDKIITDFPNIVLNLFKVDNKDTRTTSTNWLRFDVFIVNFEHINHCIQLITYYYKHSLPFEILGESMIPAGIYLFKVNSRDTRTRCKICSELTIKTLERRNLYC